MVTTTTITITIMTTRGTSISTGSDCCSGHHQASESVQPEAAAADVAAPPALSFRDVNFSYPSQIVLEDVSFDLKASDFMAVIGPNGGGKSTLIKLALGLLSPEKGEVKVLGTTASSARPRIGYVPQNVNHNLDFPVRVRDVVVSGRIRRGLWQYGKDDREAAMAALEQVGIADLADRRIGRLSGGQRQRALVARALASDPELLLLDEPTASMDGPAQSALYELLTELNKSRPIMVVSHDLSIVGQHVNCIACVNRCLHYHEGAHVTREALETTWGHPVDCLLHDVPHRHLENHDECTHHHHHD
jgi:zinc transport system ATP-binding protein